MRTVSMNCYCFRRIRVLLILGFTFSTLFSSWCVPSEIDQQRAIDQRAQELKEFLKPRVVKQHKELKRSLLFQAGGMHSSDGGILDIKHSHIASPERDELCLLATPLAHFLDIKKRTVRSVHLQNAFSIIGCASPRHPANIVMSSNASGGFFACNLADAAFVDLEGKLQWKITDGLTNPITCDSADLDNDGRLELVVCDANQILLLSCTGRTIWSATIPLSSAFSFEDIDHDGMLDIHTNSGAWINGRGVVTPGAAVSDWSTARYCRSISYPEPKGSPCWLVDGPEGLIAKSTKGEEMGRFKQSSVGQVSVVAASWVRFDGEVAPILAISGAVGEMFGGSVGDRMVDGWIEAGVLQLFDAHGELCFEEILPGPVTAMSVIQDGAAEVLIVATREHSFARAYLYFQGDNLHDAPTLEPGEIVDNNALNSENLVGTKWELNGGAIIEFLAGGEARMLNVSADGSEIRFKWWIEGNKLAIAKTRDSGPREVTLTIEGEALLIDKERREYLRRIEGTP